jgi:acetyl/propionyl-CoA carboxylase alpha subunit
MRILIANRGEVARRIIRTAHALGHETVAVFADPDADTPHVSEARRAVRIGPADLAASYLSSERLLDAARGSSADAVHPGYGFLSESADFARAVIDAGLTWIGPHPDAIAAMGSKIEARRIAADAGVPTIPGYDASQKSEELRAAAEEIGYPVLVKASAGGGGKGIRVVTRPEAFDEALATAREEARRSFADDRVIIERYISRPRHVEVQVIGDTHGTVLDLGTRECSVQRRYQKLLEEAPAPNLTDATRVAMQDAARSLAAAIRCDSAGTVEFVVDTATEQFFFLEMNTRLQVEHPVTELITGLDLVALQLRAALGEYLGGLHVTFSGHAFEARINAEDVWEGFRPQTGRVTDLVVPAGVRWDSGIEAGDAITPHYDPMIAKLITAGPDRETARRRLAAALDGLLIGGLVTNSGFHRWLVARPEMVDGRVTTRFLDEVELPPPPDEAQAAAMAAEVWVRSRAIPDSGPWRALGPRRVTPGVLTRTVHLQGSSLHDIAVTGHQTDAISVVDAAARRVVVAVDGHSHTFRVLTRSERWAPASSGAHGHAGAALAPFPGVIAEVRVAPGDGVAAGQTLVVIEAMKMLHPLPAPGVGVIDEVRVSAGDQVAGDQVIVTFRTENGVHE